MTEAWKRFLTLYLIQFLQLLDFISITPTGALFVADHRIQSSSISFSLSAYSVMAILGSMAITKLRKYGPKFTMLLLLSIFMASQLLLAIQVNDFFFITSRTIGGLTGGLMGSIAYSQLSSVDKNNLGVWNGRIQTAQSMVTLAGLPLCLLAISILGTRLYFIIITALTLVVIFQLSTSLFLKDANPNSRSFSLLSLKKHPDIILTGFLCYLASFLFISHMPNYLINVKHVSANDLSLAYAVSGIITFLFSGSIGKLGDHLNAKILLLITAFLIIAVQGIFLTELNSSAILFIGLPLYLLLSTARAIYQRGVILQKKSEDSVSMHLINNVAIRAGILLSGIILGGVSAKQSDISSIFSISNVLAIVCGGIVIVWLTLDSLHKRKKSSWIKQ